MLSLIYLIRTGLIYLLVTKEIWPEADSAGKFLEINHIIAVLLGELYVIGFCFRNKTINRLVIREKAE